MMNGPELLEIANKFCDSAPNEDWQRRGIVQKGKARLVAVHNPDYLKEDEIIGYATVAYFKFQKPLKKRFAGDSGFIGFTLGAMNVNGKVISDASPVITKLYDRDIEMPCLNLSRRFCPQCLKLDSVKMSSRRMGPECVRIRYHCRCGYEDVDVMD